MQEKRIGATANGTGLTGRLDSVPMRYVLGAFLLFAATTWAQDAPLVSGPPAGTPLGKVEVFAPTGPRAGQTFDAAAALGQGPGALLFIHVLNRNTAPMINGLERVGKEYGLLGLRTFTVFLAEDRTAGEAQVQRSSQAMRLSNPMVISTDGAEGPGSYALNRRCTLTLVLANEGKVVAARAFTDTGPQDVPDVEAAVATLTGPMPQDLAGMRELLAKRFPDDSAELRELTAGLLLQVRRQAQDGQGNARMAGAARERPNRPAMEPAAEGAPPPAAAQREGKAPDDDELRNLLRDAIQRTASDEDLDDVFGRIDARVAAAGIEAQAIEMFKLMVSLGYGTDSAQTRAKKYLQARGVTPPKTQPPQPRK